MDVEQAKNYFLTNKEGEAIGLIPVVIPIIVMQIYPDEIISFFREQKGIFKTRYGVLMKMSKDQESFYTNHQLPELGEKNVRLKIVMDVDTSHSFIAGSKLQHIDDIDRISYNYLWTRYLNSEGTVLCKTA